MVETERERQGRSRLLHLSPGRLGNAFTDSALWHGLDIVEVRRAITDVGES
jgi:hypothetical protein